MKIKFAYRYDDNKLPIGTICTVEDGDTLYTGEASCNRRYDFPEKRIGRKVAFGKAIKDLPREVRTALWERYKSMCKV